MLDRPFYQPAIAFLAVILFIGGTAMAIANIDSPGIRIVPGTATPGASDSVLAKPGNTARVNINTANAEELAEALPGIGPTLSHRIVDHRAQHGPFVRTDQIMQVSGIGETTYERLRELITVGE